MQEGKSIWYNGKLVPWHEATVHVLCHTLHYGGGAFEGIRFYKTGEDSSVFRLEEHVDRLLYSAGVLRMALPYSKGEIIDAILTVVRDNGLEEGYIRPLVFYGYGKLGVNPAGAPVDLIIACWPWKSYLAHDRVDIKTSRYIRIHPNSTIVDAKLCGHYVNSILASLELRGTHYHEALLLDSNGYVAEGVAENFFIIKDGKIYTPQLGTILAGITRDTIIQLAAYLGYELTATNIPIDMVYNADEAFFTGTAAEVTPIRSLDDKVLGEDKIGPITTAIKENYLNLVRGKNPDFARYLTKV